MAKPKVTLKDLALLLKEAKRQEKADSLVVKRLQKKIEQEKKKRKVDEKVRKLTGQLPKIKKLSIKKAIKGSKSEPV